MRKDDRRRGAFSWWGQERTRERYSAISEHDRFLRIRGWDSLGSMQDERSALPIGGEHPGHRRTRYSSPKYPSIREREPKRASCVGRDSHGPGERTGRDRVELTAHECA